MASTPVVVAAKALPVGALVGPNDVRRRLAAKSPLTGAFAKADDVVGRGLLAAVLENEPITTAKLAPRKSVPAWRRQSRRDARDFGVRVNEVIGVAGFVVPGAHVDVVATVDVKDETTTRTVVNNLQVLTSGTRYEQPGSKGRQAHPVDRRDAPGDPRRRRAGGARVDDGASCCSSCGTRWTSPRRSRPAWS